MMKTYLDNDSEALDGFEFLTMAEAGEVGHWSILKDTERNSGGFRGRSLGRLGGLADPETSFRGRDERLAETRPRRRPERARLNTH